MAATISINPLNINYKQFDAAPTAVLITFSNLSYSVISFGNVPNWLVITDITQVDSTTATAIFAIKPTESSALSASLYTAVLEVLSPKADPVSLEDVYFKEADFTINLTITETVLLAVTPANISFNYTISGALPSGKLAQIVSENAWTIVTSAAWISSSVTTGSNNGSFSVSVDPYGLATGTHTGTVTVDDGSSTKIINISLVVSAGNTVDDYLYVAPTELDFVKNIGSLFNPIKSISLNSSEVWTAVSSETWLVLSKTTGSSGSDLISVSIDATGLLEGLYVAEVAVTAGTILRKTYVTLLLNTSTVNIPDNGLLYFSEEDVDLKAVTDTLSLLYNKKAPYIKGVASVNIGTECKNMIKSAELPDVYTSKRATLLKPAVLSFNGYEKNYFTSVVLDAVERNSLYFLNGKTPSTPNKLTYVPSEITVSRKAILALHIYKTIKPGAIVISGAVNKTITADESANSNIYTAFINLNELNINELDVLTISFDFLQIKVKIKEEAAESILLAFENEWQLPEFFELSGGLSISNNANFATQKTQKEADIYEKIYEAKPNETFSLYTGYIESEEEVKWLEKILSSKRMYLYLNHKKLEVIPTFRNLEVYQTREHQYDYKLTFKKAFV